MNQSEIIKLFSDINEFNKKHDLDIDGQALQLSAENGELCEAINKKDTEEIREEVADVLFVAISIAELEGIDAIEALREITDENLDKNTSKEGNKVTKS